MSISLVPYIVLNGQAEEATRFYAEVFGAEILMLQKFGDMPSDPSFPMPEELKSLVAHAHLRAGDAQLFLYDAMSGNETTQGNRVSICINTADASRSKRLFDALSEGGTVVNALEETFFSPAFGSVIDKYGVGFTISTQPAQPQ